MTVVGIRLIQLNMQPTVAKVWRDLSTIVQGVSDMGKAINDLEEKGPSDYPAQNPGGGSAEGPGMGSPTPEKAGGPATGKAVTPPSGK